MGTKPPEKENWRLISRTASTLAILMAVYQLLSTQILLLSHVQHLNLHLLMGLSIVFMNAAEESPKWRVLFLLFFLAGIIATGYIHLEANALPDREQMPTDFDTLVGFVIIALSIVAAYRSFGIILPIMAVLGIFYALYGRYFPGALFHAGVGPVRLIAMLTTDLDGIYGTLLFISATYMAVFLTLGSFIENSGAAQFFIDFPLAIFRGVKAGGGYAAVMASALMGMGSGSPVANVVTTGTFTIPLMKRTGFLPHVAGVIEAAASTGGQIMPPVMGAVAFVMSEFTATPYVKIMGYALFPAILYFLAVGFSIRFRANLKELSALPSEETPDIRTVLQSWKFFLPILVLVGVLVAGYTPGLAAFWAVVSIVLVITPRKPDISFLSTIRKCLKNGGKNAGEFAAAMACISIFVKVVMGTGVGLKLPILIAEYAGSSLPLAYLLTAIASTVLGMGLPTVAAYIVVAVLAVPALTHLGAGLLQAHFFVLYFSILSALTPPVALAALAGAKVANADYLKTSWASLQFGYVAYLIPFLFALNPALIALGSPAEIIMAVVGTFTGCTLISACIQGYFLNRTSMLDRLLLLVASVGSLVFVWRPGMVYGLFALLSLVVVLLKQGGWAAAGFGKAPEGADAPIVRN